MLNTQWIEDYEKLLVSAASYSGSKTPGNKSISASSLSNDMLQLYLDFKYGKKEGTKFEASHLGSIYQLGVDKACEGNQQYISGKRFRYTLSNGWELSGEIDQIDLVNKVIIDNKVSTATALKKVMTEGLNHQYALQLGVYKLLANKNLNDSFSTALAFVDKSASYFKPTSGQTMNYLNIETHDVATIEQMAIDKTNQLQEYIDNDIMPERCTDLFPFKSKGYTRAMRCIYYCSYSSVCPYNNQYSADNHILANLEPRDLTINQYAMDF